mmetsp:Transcript_2003/g.4518  ORF Transcript_2003/g.4518 Transcript_2003/m.4518 type:complete len:216 (-) Transcript_2003:446-1093(-)
MGGFSFSAPSRLFFKPAWAEAPWPTPLTAAAAASVAAAAAARVDADEAEREREGDELGDSLSFRRPLPGFSAVVADLGTRCSLFGGTALLPTLAPWLRRFLPRPLLPRSLPRPGRLWLPERQRKERLLERDRERRGRRDPGRRRLLRQPSTDREDRGAKRLPGDALRRRFAEAERRPRPSSRTSRRRAGCPRSCLSGTTAPRPSQPPARRSAEAR